jgi:hypothetical protein
MPSRAAGELSTNPWHPFQSPVSRADPHLHHLSAGILAKKRKVDTMLSEREKQSYHRIYRKTCPVCGTEFETFNPKARYNSHICSRRAKKGKQL